MLPCGMQLLTLCDAPHAGLLGFQGTITPGAGPSAFAPSTSSGFSLGAMAAAGSAAGPGSTAFPAFILPAADGLKSQVRENALIFVLRQLLDFFSIDTAVPPES